MEEGPLGKLLVERGVVHREALDDALARQARRLPVASQCYLLGYASERSLASALAAQSGRPAVVVDECVVKLSVLNGLSRELAFRALVLPVYEDRERVVIAAATPERVGNLIREIERVRGKRADLHIALEVTLARAIRACFSARERGDSYWTGADAIVDPSGIEGRLEIATAASFDGTYTDHDTVRPDDDHYVSRTDHRLLDVPDYDANVHRAVLEDVTKELSHSELIPEEDEGAAGPRAWEDAATGRGPSWQDSPSRSASNIDTFEHDVVHHDDDDDDREPLSDDLDRSTEVPVTGPPRILIVDDDFATRHLLVKELQPMGYVTATAASGAEALRSLQSHPPSLVIADVLLPEIDGFRLCRAVKRSQRLRQVPVILMSAVIDSGRVTDDVLARYGADAYLEKPLDIRRLHHAIRELLGRSSGGTQGDGAATFAKAIQRYQTGDLDGAIVLLRESIAIDPRSAKHRFVLANLLQRKAMLVEAIDEYEAVLELEPQYFPALTRLAYLYYKQGHLARAIETWRRSLPMCHDPVLRRNIELFMRKLIADMNAHDSTAR